MSTDRFDLLRKSSYKSSDLLIDIDRFDNGQDIIRISSKYREVGSYYYEGLLLNVSGMDERLPIDCQFKLQGDALMTFANSRLMCQTPAEPMPRLSDLLGDWLGGAKVTIRQYFEGCTWADVENEEAFVGWIKNPQTVYDENEIQLVASPTKKYPDLPPHVLNRRDYGSMDADSGEMVMQIAIGDLTYDGKHPYSATGDMTAPYAGAVLLAKNTLLYPGTSYTHYAPADLPRPGETIPFRMMKAQAWLKKVLDDVWLLASALPSYNIDDVYSDGTHRTENTVWFEEQNDGGGPDWRTLTLAKILGVYWDPTKEWTCNIQGMKDSDAPHLLTRDPIQVVFQILHQVYGMTWSDSTWNELDLTSASLWLTNWLAGENLYCDGLLDRKQSLERFLSDMMMQFPFWIYRGRNGKFFAQKWERKPDVDYTDTEVSFKNHIFREGFSVGYRQPKGPAIDMLYWPHHGRDISSSLPIPLEQGYFTRAYITLEVERSGYVLGADYNDTVLTFAITGSGHHPLNGDLIMIGREVMEVRLPISGTGNITVRIRGGNGTKAAAHLDDDSIYILHPASAVGDVNHDQLGVEPLVAGQTCRKIIIWEDALHTATINIGDAGGNSDIDLHRDKTWGMSELQDSINMNGNIYGTYVCEWDPLVNFVTIRTSDSKSFKIQLVANDWMVKVMGWWADTGMGTSHTGTQPARFREAQLTYDYAVQRTCNVRKLRASMITGAHLNRTLLADYGDAICDLTPMVARDKQFDTNHRPMRQVKFNAPDQFVDLAIGKIFAFADDINDHLKREGNEWTDLNWIVAKTRRLDMHNLEIIAEEAT
jgi:hypothetical protein